jgi:hypothetical protein
VLGLLLGVVAWAAAAFLFGRDLTDVSSASSETFEELERRVRALRGRLEFLRSTHLPEAGAGAEAVQEADRVTAELERDLGIQTEPGERDRDVGIRTDSGTPGSPYRWLLGHGYVNAWRDLHYAEDLLLNAEPGEVVFASALTNLDRLAGSQPSASATMLTRKLGDLVGLETQELPPSLLAGNQHPVTRCGASDARAIVRESAKRIPMPRTTRGTSS